MARLRPVIQEVRDILAVLYRIACAFLFTFLAGALVGTFLAGISVVADMAPGH